MVVGIDTFDLGVIFNVSPGHCRNLYVMKKWMVNLNIGVIDMESYLNNKDEIRRASYKFSRRSNGVLKGAIGSIDR